MEKHSGAFSPAPERPLQNWLIELAQARAENYKTDFSTALAQVKKENPQLVEADRLETTGRHEGEDGPAFLQLMRRALEIAQKAKGLTVEECLERAAVENPDLARAARAERGGTLYAGELHVAPGIGSRQVLMSDGVEAALDPSKHLVKLANELRDRKSIGFTEALLKVGSDHPELARAAREQALRKRLD